MKTIGLIGGMSWESTAHYYTLLNRLVKERLGGRHSAKLVLYSVEFYELSELVFAGKWDEAAAIVVDAAKRLQRAGADFVLIGANTMHIAAETIEQAISIPLVHIADATGRRIADRGLRRVGLIGTAFTMEKGFYRDRLREKFGLDVILPSPEQRTLVHKIIVDELVLGIVKPESKAKLRAVMAQLTADGSDGIVLGCTEFMTIVDDTDCTVPLFDTTTIHVEAAVELALCS